MKKNFKNTFLYTAVLLGICGISACNHITDIFTSKKSSYYNDKMISADKFAALTKITDKGVKKFQAQNGLFILMDASDSTIIASYTTDNSAAVTDKLYDSGSVFKTFDVAMGLESGKVKNSDKFDTSKPFVIDGLRVTDPHGSHKSLSPERILVESSNIGAAKIAAKVGGEYQYNFFDKLGLLSKINSYNIESATPVFMPKEEWINNKKVITTVSFGYGVADTPLHIITAYAAIINGGKYYKPSLDKIANKEGSYVISEKNSALMRGYLRKVVTDGTARRADSDKYVLMGKTGSADKLNLATKEYNHDNAITTFVGNFEHNGVDYAILVMLDSPKALKETYGYNTAGWNVVPITGNIIEEFIK
jgi:cell division protein FtsI (penicillin-binding protein 3)